jgi:hypothetical protein
MITIKGVSGKYTATSDNKRHLKWLLKRYPGGQVVGRSTLVKLACDANRARIGVEVNGTKFPQL